MESKLDASNRSANQGSKYYRSEKTSVLWLGFLRAGAVVLLSHRNSEAWFWEVFGSGFLQGLWVN